MVNRARTIAHMRLLAAAVVVGHAAMVPFQPAGAAATTAVSQAPSTAAAPAPVATIRVDATEASRGIMSAHLELPVSAGPLTLLYPKWLPGRHSPAGPITSLSGPRFTVTGPASGLPVMGPLPWQRDPIDLNAFHLDIPAGSTRLQAELEILTSPAPDGVVQGLEAPRTATESLLILEWHQLMLYPVGSRSDDLSYQASVRLPLGWKFATALKTTDAGSDAGADYGVVQFATTSLTTLMDSTLIAGRYFQDVPLGGSPAVTLHMAGDTAVALTMKPEIEAHYRRLVREATTLFGATHYDHYEFLWTLTDQIMPDGLEHHESSDNRSPLRALLDDPTRRAEANLLAHEYVHSWNGKYRRPSGIATPDYQSPMQDAMLWVYEGLTEYLGDVLATRSGLLTEQEFRDELAHIAAAMDSHSGREWRSLQDATIAAPLLYYQSRSWAARLRRQEDFYQESALLWLEADTLIRRGSKGKKTLDDFCRLFYGAPNTSPRVVPYGFDAVVGALNTVYPYDWAGFWNERLHRLRPGAPLEGLQAAGWRLALTSNPSIMHLAHEADDKDLDLRYSLGFYVDDDGATIGDVIPRSPADLAGASPGSHVIALNGYKWSKELLHDTLAAPPTAAGMLTLWVEKDGAFKTLDLHYAGGERYPNLLKVPGTEDLLKQIVRPRAGE